VDLTVPQANQTFTPPIAWSDLPDTQSPNYPPPFLQIPNPAVRNGNLDSAIAYCHKFVVSTDPEVYDLQYWLFYAIRGWSTLRMIFSNNQEFDIGLFAPPGQPYVGLGEHQGDWKHVSVRINQGQVQGVFYGQHSGGFWLPADQAPFNGTQPIVYSGANTHSCYPIAGKFN
jgi:hypothetical protein